MKRMPSEVFLAMSHQERIPGQMEGTLNETPNISRYSRSHFQQSENGHPVPLRLSTIFSLACKHLGIFTWIAMMDDWMDG